MNNYSKCNSFGFFGRLLCVFYRNKYYSDMVQVVFEENITVIVV